ncbi:eukaryotic translation initiation factor 2-alpha kinase, partial [Spiromyces aspiralis]
MVPDLTVDEGRRDMNPSTQEIQQNELEALRAIYMDDYKDVKPETVWKIAQYAPEFVVKIRSLDEQYREKVHVGLHVRFTKTYPNTAPQLALQEVFGLNDSQVSVAIQELQKKASQMIGSEMVYDLCTWLEEYVTNNNIADQITGHSFHDEMMQRAKARNEDIQKQARKIRQHQLEQQREDRQKLEEMIKAEVTRKEENLLKQKRHLSYSLASGEDPESMYRMVGQWAHQLRELRFESPVTVDHQPGVARSNMFNSVVLERTGLRNGLYRVMNAYPIDPDLIGHVNRAQRYIVHEYVIDNDYYLEGGSGEKELQKVVHEIQELTYVRHAHLVPVYATMIQAMEGKGQRLYVLMESYGEAIGSNNTLRTVLN